MTIQNNMKKKKMTEIGPMSCSTVRLKNNSSGAIFRFI